MKKKNKKIDRRDFLKTVGAAGIGSAFASAGCTPETSDPNDPNVAEESQKPKFPQVPRRNLGKTGVKVPCLSLGHSLNQTVLKTALDWGVNYWDTSLVAIGGNSELEIGKFLKKNPQTRKNLFLVTKESESKNAADLEKCLQTSLQRMNTTYIDLYIGVYIMSDPARLTDEVKQWAKSAKERKLIRFFGFTTHSNIAQCLTAAAKLDWIDAIMTRYNFRSVHEPKINAAVEACHKTGIGIVAMKTQAATIQTEEDKKLTEHFLKRGFTNGEAKIKAVLEDKRISSACVSMSSVALLTTNIAAILDKTKLTREDFDVLAQYAAQTCSGYCAGCSHICNPALPDMPYVSDIMRYLMYYNSYGEHQHAKELFAQIPGNVRNRLLTTDYSLAEARCPQHLPINKLIAEAVSKMA